MSHAEFKRSSKNRALLKSIQAELMEFDKTWDWKIFYPTLFCLTRWLGMLQCADILSRKSNRVMLKEYVQRLRDDRFGPRDFDPYKYQKRRRQRDAEDAEGDNCDGVDSEEEAELQRVQEAIEDGRLDADGYQPQPQLFASAEEAAASAPSQAQCIRADNFDDGRAGATGRKCKNLLNKDVGLTDLNCGRSAYLAGLLKPYQVLLQQLQRIGQPEQHLTTRRIRQFYMIMKMSWIGTADTETGFASRNFREWMEEMEACNKTELVKLVKEEARAFTTVFVASVKDILSVTWDYIQALDLIDPMGPELEKYVTPSVSRGPCGLRFVICVNVGKLITTIASINYCS